MAKKATSPEAKRSEAEELVRAWPTLRQIQALSEISTIEVVPYGPAKLQVRLQDTMALSDKGPLISFGIGDTFEQGVRHLIGILAAAKLISVQPASRTRVFSFNVGLQRFVRKAQSR